MNAEQHQRIFAALDELKLIGVNAQRQWVLDGPAGSQSVAVVPVVARRLNNRAFTRSDRFFAPHRLLGVK